MKTLDNTGCNIEKVGKLFPNCLTEIIGEDGSVHSAIDFDVLRQELSKEIVEGNQERYQFTWPDKKQAIRLANAPTSMTLRPCREESVDFDNTENLYIEGDNLEVLKLLREDYLGKIKVIYIDPPYNTGNDFVYEDDFSQVLSEYIGISGQLDDVGNRLAQNTESNGRFHTDWLNMIFPRLKVARDLLSEDGVIFISIDDNEVENLKKVCDEIFGSDNYQATMTVQVRYGEKSLNEEKPFKPMLEYVLVYAKNANYFNPNRPAEQYGLDKFVYEIKELTSGTPLTINGQDVVLFKKGEWDVIKHEEGSLSYLKDTWISGSVYTNMSYGQVFQKVVEPRVNEDGLGCLYKVLGRGDDGLGFRYYTGPQKASASRGKMFSGVPLSRVEEIKNGTGSLRYKPILCFNDYSADFGNIRHEGGIPFNSGKKPVKMLTNLINLQKDKNCVVLDFFSGSASTAHAVFAQNVIDGGNRRFIMVQIPEEIEKNNELRKEGFSTICEIGKERIRRAGKKILSEITPNEDTGSLFAGIENKKPSLDIGFRVLKLDSSNMEDVYYKPEESSEATLFEDNVKPDRTGEDLLFQVMLECNLPLSAKIETEKIAGKEVFSVNNSYLIACFDEDVNEEVITAVAKRKPYYFIMRDKSLSSDNVADNFEQIFQAYSKETIRRIL